MARQSARSKSTTVLKQLCNLIPAYLVPRLAHEHGISRQARSYSPWSHVVSLLYAHLIHAFSLNDVCDGLGNHKAKLFAIRQATPPKRNTLSHANRTRDAKMAEQLFWGVLEHLQKFNPKFFGPTYGGIPRRFKRVINVVDSSTIKLIASCMDWAKHRRKKAAVKLHMRLNLQSFLPRFAIIETARHNDNKCAREMCAGIGKGEIVIFDKAYLDFVHLWELTQRDVWWVSRSKENMQFRVCKRLIKKPVGKIVRDDIVVPKNLGSRGKYPGKLRRVVAMVEVEGKEREMTFLSNHLDWAAQSIADLYRARWSIEAFFKQIKQTLQLSDFLGHNKNAILWQVWTALLLYVIIRYQAFLSKWSYGFQRLFCVLRTSIWNNLDLDVFLPTYGTAGGLPRISAMPQMAYLPGNARYMVIGQPELWDST